MENLGIPLGLTLFVLMTNLPIYVILSLDSHVIRLPSRVAAVLETLIDAVFAIFVAGLHFNERSSWFWSSLEFARHALSVFLYLVLAVLLIKPHKPYYSN
jgi:hypothetical protein